MSALAQLRAAYTGRAGAAQRTDGHKTVGLVGTTLPTELVVAAGAQPVAVAELPGGATPIADRYLEAHFEAGTRATLDALLSGRLAALDLLVLSRAADADLELYYVLKEAVRLGRADGVPPLHLYDLLHGRTEANRTYGMARLQELRSRLEALTGQAPTDARLRTAAAALNHQRSAINRLQSVRRGGSMSGVDAMVAIGAGRFMELEAHTRLLDEYLQEQRRPHGGPRVLVTAGVPLSSLAVHEAIEAAGAVVVGEDDAWGARAGGALVDASADDILGAVFDKYFLDVPSPRLAPAAARDEWLRAQLDIQPVDALIVYVPRSDHWFGWDFPRLRDLAAERGVPALLLRDADPGPVAEFLAAAVGA